MTARLPHQNAWDSAKNDSIGEQSDIYSDFPGRLQGAAVLPSYRAQVAELEGALTEMRDRWMRAEAEIVHVKTRAKKDVDDARQYGTQKFAADVVETAENLRRGWTLSQTPVPILPRREIVRRFCGNGAELRGNA